MGLSSRRYELLGLYADLDSANFDLFFMRKPSAAPKVLQIHRCSLFVQPGSDIRSVNISNKAIAISRVLSLEKK